MMPVGTYIGSACSAYEARAVSGSAVAVVEPLAKTSRLNETSTPGTLNPATETLNLGRTGVQGSAAGFTLMARNVPPGFIHWGPLGFLICAEKRG